MAFDAATPKQAGHITVPRKDWQVYRLKLGVFWILLIGFSLVWMVVMMYTIVVAGPEFATTTFGFVEHTWQMRTVLVFIGLCELIMFLIAIDYLSTWGDGLLTKLKKQHGWDGTIACTIGPQED